ncbi:MAG: hypothetical protein AB1815_03270 [Bacillota bacterium]
MPAALPGDGCLPALRQITAPVSIRPLPFSSSAGAAKAAIDLYTKLPDFLADYQPQPRKIRQVIYQEFTD